MINLNEQTRDDLIKQRYKSAVIKFKVTKSFYGRHGEAEFIKVEKYLNSDETPRDYNSEDDLETTRCAE